ncbi:alcohol dehydrogenase [Vibrio sp. MACH09]|uniref:iron-containing alcohol dehydrogenase n=1 Tax=unclassified Vibrio TaxID=2614977 RepID=UPI001493A874|nr:MULTISPECIES: iron-containing alcohol dehydrogenase [unclassified Vibrio]NOI67567.1 iron-containing alcohol dehydrogenase [Vibrio sp. 99-8-1]GLO61298.1 alcohol dehydrogenase [Vibrio sp. MACH09]
MLNFSFQNTTRIHFGPEQIQKVKEEIPLDAKVLLLYGGGSIKSNGVYDQVTSALSEHNLFEFSGIEPNPKYHTLMKAVALIKEQGIDYLLAVGGGSVVDGTKFVSAAACFDGDDPWDIITQQLAVKKALPIGAVLTLPATGSESNGGSVVTRDDHKLAFGSPLVRPAFAVLDPTTTLSLSPRQVSNGVVDAFVHIMEQYLTYPVNGKVQDSFAEGLLRILIEEGPKALAEESKNDIDVRSNIMWSATMALNGLIGAGVPQDWATHMIGHELTAAHGIDHARTLSIVLPAIMKVKIDQKGDKLLQYGKNVWGITQGSDDEIIAEAIAKTEQFFKAMDVPVRFSDVELDASHIDELVQNLEAHQMLALGEHGDITLEVSRKILQTAL